MATKTLQYRTGADGIAVERSVDGEKWDKIISAPCKATADKIVDTLTKARLVLFGDKP